jgi:hypothetical protein
MTRSVLRQVRARWRQIATIAFGLVVGYVLGSQHAWLESSDQGGFIPAEFLTTVLSAGILGSAALLGLLFLMGDKARAGGRSLLLFAAFGAAGWAVGYALGARWQDPVAHLGEAVLELAEPPGTRLTSAVTCWTQQNGDVIVRLRADSIGEVGIDRLGLELDIVTGTMNAPASGRVDLLVNRRRGYTGNASLSDLTANQASGRATFSELPAGVQRIGGWVSSVDGSTGAAIPGVPSGLDSLAGSVLWTCSPEPAPVAPPVEVPPEPVQGWFALTGLVELREPGAGATGVPYGYASGTCSMDSPLRVDALETVVPWRDGARARLRLVPEQTSATLTVTVDDGRPAQTVRSAARLVETPSGASTGSIGSRTISATFPLAEGDLSLSVEWDCGDNFEE